jgi:hypothetical protein
VQDREDSTMFAGMQFDLIPGHDTIEEYRPEIAKLWDDARECVNNYFLHKF